MNFINSIRRAVANAIAPSNVGTIANGSGNQLSAPQPTVQQIPAGVRSFSTPTMVNPERVTVGHISLSDLEGFSSLYLRDAIAQLGAWSELAQAFTAYERQYGRKVQDFGQYQKHLESFHAWNAATSTEKQMDDEKVIVTLDKLAEASVPRGNDQTDAIIARVRKCTVDDVRAERIKKAEQKAAARREMLSAIAAEVWKFTGDAIEPTISAAKCEAKAIQTLEWIATSWQGDPANVAAELLLIEDDLQHIKYAARQEANHDGDNTF